MAPFTECLHCGCSAFQAGPGGGLSLNLYCTRCKAGYSVFLLPDGYFLDQEISPPEQEVDADRFRCAGCFGDIISIPRRIPAPSLCAVCSWIEEFIADADERRELRRRLRC